MVAAYVHVAHACNALVVQALKHLSGVEAQEHVVVPCVAMGMHENRGIGKVVVVVDDIGQVDLTAQLACVAHNNEGAHTMASRPLFLGILFSASGLSTS